MDDASETRTPRDSAKAKERKESEYYGLLRQRTIAMNARLEEEYARYIAEHKGGAPGDTVTLNVKDVAEQFYNLALEDVKKEVNRRYDDNLAASDKFSSMSSSRALFASAAKEDFDIVSFIDNKKSK